MAAPIILKSQKWTKHDLQDSFQEEVWDTLGKSVATSSPQDLTNKQIHSKVRQTLKVGNFRFFQFLGPFLTAFSFQFGTLWTQNHTYFLGSIGHSSTQKQTCFLNGKIMEHGLQMERCFPPGWFFFEVQFQTRKK